MRTLYRIAVLFAFLVPALARADTTFTLDHSQPGDRSLQINSDLTETVSGMPTRAPRVTIDFTSLHELSASPFDAEAGRPLRGSMVQVDFNPPGVLNLLRWDRKSKVTAEVVTTPEPGSLALLAAGLAGCASLKRRRRSC